MGSLGSQCPGPKGQPWLVTGPGEARRDSSAPPMDLFWIPAHAPTKQQVGRVLPSLIMPGQEEDSAERCTVGGACAPLSSPFWY